MLWGGMLTGGKCCNGANVLGGMLQGGGGGKYSSGRKCKGGNTRHPPVFAQSFLNKALINTGFVSILCLLKYSRAFVYVSFA